MTTAADRTSFEPPVSEQDTGSISGRIVIVGGGIAGLSTAWYLRQQAQSQGIRVSITVLEASNRWGGKILTDEVEGFGEEPFIVEGGPDSFLTQKPWALQLARELGLEDRLLNTNDEMRKVFVLSGGKPIPLPDGVLLIVPTRFMPFALSPLLSPFAKLRMGLDLVIPAKRDGEDETIAEFIRRRLGNEALDKIAEPLMSGIYNAEAEKQSLLATFPRFRALEEEHGSLIRGMLASRKAHAAPNGKTGSPAGANNGAPARKPSMFTSLRGGTRELVDTLVGKLAADTAIDMRLGAKIETVEQDGGAYTVVLSDGKRVAADAVILATPSYIAARLVDSISTGAAKALSQIRYVSTGTISLGFRRSEISHPLNGFGLVIPRSENRPINAITWTSTKFNHRAPEGYVLLRVFFGGSRHPEMMDKSDGELEQIICSELKRLMGITAEPVFQRIYRWREANPQYDKGHLQTVDAVEAALPPGLYVTGSPYRGIGIPDCVNQAQQTAGKVVAQIKESIQ